MIGVETARTLSVIGTDVTLVVRLRRSTGRRPGAPVDLGLDDPAAQRLGVDAQLLADPLQRPDRVAGSRRASTAIRVARSRSSSGYFLGAAMTLILTWIESLHQTRYGTSRSS